MTLKIGIFDDHPLIGQGLRGFLENAMGAEITFISESQEDLLLKLERNHPDILIMDVVVPDVKGLEAFEGVCKQYPEIQIIAYTTLSSAIMIENLFSLGVKGYVNKRAPIEEMQSAIEAVAAGNLYAPEAFDFLIKVKNDKLRQVELTSRELEILDLIAEGKKTKQIAEALFISPNTVENHRSSLFKKLDAGNVAELIRNAYQMGLIGI